MATYTVPDEIAKLVYDTESMRSLLPKHVGLWDRYKKWDGPYDVGVKGWNFAVTTELPDSAGWMAYTGTTRTPLIPQDRNGVVYAKQFHATLEIDEATLNLLDEGKKKAYRAALEHLKETLVLTMARRRAIAIYGQQSGVVAYCTANEGPTATIHVGGMYGFTTGDGSTKVNEAAEMFYPGNRVVIDCAGTPAYRTIASRSVANNTITLSGGNVTVTAGMAICFGDSASMDYSASNLAPHGFGNLFDTTFDYEGVAVATSPMWNPNVYTGSTPGTEEQLDSGHITAVVLGTSTNGGMDVNVLVMNECLLQAFVRLYEQQIRYQPGEFKGGMREVTWDLPGKPVTLFFDPIAPHSCIIGLTEAELAKFVAKEGDWLARDGSMFKYVADSTKWRAVWAELWNIGTRKRNAHAIHKDIEEPVRLFV